MNNRLSLSKLSNGNIEALFSYDIGISTSSLVFKFIEQQRRDISKLFSSTVYLKFGTPRVMGGQDFSADFVCLFSNINIEEVKNTLTGMFPVIIVNGDL